jgi:hypothetical protein
MTIILDVFVCADGVGDDTHDGKDCNHDEHSYNPPEHMAFAVCALFLVFGIRQKFNNAVQEVRKRNGKHEHDQRVDDDLVHFFEQTVNIGICNWDNKRVKHLSN